MELVHARILWQMLLSVASLVCIVIGIRWIRSNYLMYKCGESRPLLLPFPPFMMMDILRDMGRMISRNRFPNDMEEQIESMRFESIITSNYVNAFVLLVLSFVAGMLVFRVPG